MEATFTAKVFNNRSEGKYPGPAHIRWCGSLLSISNWVIRINICSDNCRRNVPALFKQWLKMPNTACTGQFHKIK